MERIKKRKYWDIADVYNHRWEDISYEEAKQQLEVLLREAVSKRMMADVPVGEFLSGGYDSLHWFREMAQSISTKPINTYSLVFMMKN